MAIGSEQARGPVAWHLDTSVVVVRLAFVRCEYKQVGIGAFYKFLTNNRLPRETFLSAAAHIHHAIANISAAYT
jgi:hypothetical protein